MRNLKLKNSILKLMLTTLPLLSANSVLEAKSELDPELKLRGQMVQVSKDLGVTCTFCHSAENFKDSKMANFAIAREHFRVVRILNSEQGFNGKPQVSCYTCHQGRAKFDYLMKKVTEK